MDDAARALSAHAIRPTAIAGQLAFVNARSQALPAMPSASAAIMTRGVTWLLPSQPQTMRPGTATAVATEKRKPAATGVYPIVVR